MKFDFLTLMFTLRDRNVDRATMLYKYNGDRWTVTETLDTCIIEDIRTVCPRSLDPFHTVPIELTHTKQGLFRLITTSYQG